MSTLKDRFFILLELEGLNPNQFYTQTGLANGFLDKVGSRMNRSTIDKIKLAFPKWNIDYLLTGKGEKRNEASINIEGNSNFANTGSVGGSINSSGDNELLNRKIKELEKVNKELTTLIKSTSSMEDEFEKLFSGREIARLEKENKQLIEENKRLIEENGYYKGLLDRNGISYK